MPEHDDHRLEHCLGVVEHQVYYILKTFYEISKKGRYLLRPVGSPFGLILLLFSAAKNNSQTLRLYENGAERTIGRSSSSIRALVWELSWYFAPSITKTVDSLKFGSSSSSRATRWWRYIHIILLSVVTCVMDKYTSPKLSTAAIKEILGATTCYEIESGSLFLLHFCLLKSVAPIQLSSMFKTRFPSRRMFVRNFA